MNKTTIYDVARIAGVSPTTVSRVMNNPTLVAKNTCSKVKNTIKELSYIPNMLAANMPRRKTNFIGLIIPDITNAFFSEIIRGIQDTCEKYNYSILIVNSDDNQEKESKYLKFLYSQQVDGIILTTAGHQEKNFKEEDLALLDKMNLVLIDREINGMVAPIIKIDNFRGASLAVNYLLNNGHKKIMYLSGIEGTKTNRERREGYIAALKKNQISWRKELEAGFRLDIAYKKVMKYWPIFKDSNDSPSAIFAANDLMAIGALKAFNKLKVQVPNEVSIIGFDNISFIDCTNPPLTTIAQPKYLMGKKAAETLIELIKKNKKNNLKEIIELKAELIERDSVKKQRL